MSDFDVVERPQKGGGQRGRHAKLVAAVVASADSGNAVRVALNGDDAKKVVNRIHNAVAQHVSRYHHGKLRVCRHIQDGALFIWAEKL